MGPKCTAGPRPPVGRPTRTAGRQVPARHIELGDHLRAGHVRAEVRIELAVIVIEINVELVRVVPVELAARAEVEVGELDERPTLVDVGEVQQASPVRLVEPKLIRRNGPRVVYRAITREDPVVQKAG